jgi:hypothetical protein
MSSLDVTLPNVLVGIMNTPASAGSTGPFRHGSVRKPSDAAPSAPRDGLRSGWRLPLFRV